MMIKLAPFVRLAQIQCGSLAADYMYLKERPVRLFDTLIGVPKGITDEQRRILRRSFWIGFRYALDWHGHHRARAMRENHRQLMETLEDTE